MFLDLLLSGGNHCLMVFWARVVWWCWAVGPCQGQRDGGRGGGGGKGFREGRVGIDEGI